MASSAATRNGAGRTIATIAVVSGTFMSVLGSTILNVPIANIAHDLHVSIADATLLITSQAITFATLLPLGDWIGNRFGRRKVYCIVIGTYGIAGAVGAFAPNLPVLIAVRIVQGAAAAGIVPLVMTLLAELYDPGDRPLALSAWATANSAGQALGPPLGGILTGIFGWRSIFVPATLIAVFACIGAWRYLPIDVPLRKPLEWRGAITLTLAALLLLSALTAVPQLGWRSPWLATIVFGGCASLFAFIWVIRTAPEPFVSPQAFREPSYVTSCVSIFGSTTALGAALLTIPLYLQQSPLAMALIAPFSSVLVHRYGTGGTIQLGLLAVAVAAAAMALTVYLQLGLWLLFPAMLLLGAALAAQYTAGASGATQTAAGRYGAGIGFFNLLRIAGAAAGPALVAIVLQQNAAAYGQIFAIAAVLTLLGFASTFAVERRQVIAKPT